AENKDHNKPQAQEGRGEKDTNKINESVCVCVSLVVCVCVCLYVCVHTRMYVSLTMCIIVCVCVCVCVCVRKSLEFFSRHQNLTCGRLEVKYTGPPPLPHYFCCFFFAPLSL